MHRTFKKTALWGALLLFGAIAGCETVQEPWVQSPDQWRKERARSSEIAEQLDHRLAYTQIDR